LEASPSFPPWSDLAEVALAAHPVIAAKIVVNKIGLIINTFVKVRSNWIEMGKKWIMLRHPSEKMTPRSSLGYRRRLKNSGSLVFKRQLRPCAAWRMPLAIVVRPNKIGLLSESRKGPPLPES